MRTMTALVSLLTAVILSSCGGGDPAKQAILDFTEALSDSSYTEAWELLTPESHHWYDSTVVILHIFGWTEASGAAIDLAGQMSEEEFTALTGQELFVRMVEMSPEVHNLSSSVKSVQYPVDSLAVVVLRTEEGLQEVILREVDGIWLIDLASLGPPVEGE